MNSLIFFNMGFHNVIIKLWLFSVLCCEVFSLVDHFGRFFFRISPLTVNSEIFENFLAISIKDIFAAVKINDKAMIYLYQLTTE